MNGFCKALSLSIIAGAAGVTTTHNQIAHAAPSSDINSYALFAYDHMNLKAGKNTTRGIIAGGNVGVNQISSDPNQPDLVVGDIITMSQPGQELTAHEIRMSHPQSRVWDVYGNDIPNSFPSQIVINSGPTAFTPPIINPALLPQLPTITPGANDVIVPKGGTLTLAPGHYQLLNPKDNSTLFLGDGEYHVTRFDAGKDVQVFTTDKTVLLIADKLNLDTQGVYVGPSDLARFYVAGTDKPVILSRQSEFHGQILAPNGKLNLGNGTDLFGRFWALSIGSDSNFNVTYRAPESVKGKKFRDDDGDGVQNGAEPPLAGVVFYVDYDNDGVRDAGEPFAASDANGDWLIKDVITGQYNIREEGLPGFICTTPAIVCYYAVQFSSTGTTHTTSMFQQPIIFGNQPPKVPLPESVSGRKFLDSNRDGQLSPGELGYAGITFYVDYNGNGLIDAGEPSDVSDANGEWSIGNVKQGSYTVREVGVAGYTCSFPSPNCFYTVQIGTTGQDHGGHLFGNAPDSNPESISGQKYIDADSSGTIDAGELPLQGVTFYLDINGNGVLDAGEPSAVTDASGFWIINNVTPGSYTVREVGVPGYTCTFPSSGCSYSVVVGQSGTNHGGNDFANAPTTNPIPDNITGSLSIDKACPNDPAPTLNAVTFYLDCNGNTMFDGGERSATTDANGNWSITNVGAGTCDVRPVMPAGHSCTSPAGTCSYSVTFTDTGITHTGNVFQFASPPKQSCTTTQIPEDVSGSVFLDTNCDGQQNPAEPSPAGFTFYLDCNGNSTLDTGELSAISDATGNWTITKAPAGSCTVQAIVPKDYKCVSPAGSCSYPVTIGTAGASHTGNVFGFASTIDGVCSSDRCDREDNLDISISIDGNSFRLAKLAENAVRVGQRENKSRSCRKISAKAGKAIVQRAHDEYMTLWNMAYTSFPTVTYSCDGAKPNFCVESDLSTFKSDALRRAQGISKDIKRALGSCGIKSQSGKRVHKQTKRKMKELRATIDSIPASALVCGN